MCSLIHSVLIGVVIIFNPVLLGWFSGLKIVNHDSSWIMSCQNLLWLMEVSVIFNIIWSFSSAVSFDRGSLWIFTSDAFTLTFLFHFVFTIFFFISWEFHIMSPEHTHFLVFVVPLTPLWHPTPMSNKKKNKNKKVCVAHICSGTCSNSQWLTP